MQCDVKIRILIRTATQSSWDTNDTNWIQHPSPLKGNASREDSNISSKRFQVYVTFCIATDRTIRTIERVETQTWNRFGSMEAVLNELATALKLRQDGGWIAGASTIPGGRLKVGAMQGRCNPVGAVPPLSGASFLWLNATPINPILNKPVHCAMPLDLSRCPPSTGWDRSNSARVPWQSLRLLGNSGAILNDG
jgi:hypothetical protein